MLTNLVLISLLAAGSHQGSQVGAAGFVLQNMNYGINDVFSTYEEANLISLNTGQASAQCNGEGCSVTGGSSQSVSREVEQRALYRHVVRQATDIGAESILNFQRFNSLLVKNGMNVVQCTGRGCVSSTKDESIVEGRSKMWPRSPKATSTHDKLTILFENISLGEGNIINIGDYNSDSINIGDGLSQCVGEQCVSNATKSWKTSSARVKNNKEHNSPILINTQGRLNDTDSPLIILRNLRFGEGNIVNIGDNNMISINIGDGSSQCIGDGCSSIASKMTDYASRDVSEPGVQPGGTMGKTLLPDGVFTGSSTYPYVLVFKNVTYGYGNIINVGWFNENGIVAGQGASQCIGYGCSSTSTGTFEVTNPPPTERKSTNRKLYDMRSVRKNEGSKGGGAYAPREPIELRDLYFGLGSVVNLGQQNKLSINIGDGASQCVGMNCRCEGTRAGNFSALPSDASSSSNDPMAPSKLDVADDLTTPTSVVITWEDASASPPDQSYTVNCVPGSDTDCFDKGGVRVQKIKGGAQKTTVKGLSPGTEYSCWVQLNSVILNDHCSQDPVIVTTSS